LNGIKLHNFQQSNLKNPHQDSRHNSSQNPSQHLPKHLPQTSPRSDRVRGHGALGLPVKRLWGQWRTIGWGVLNVLGISLGVMLVGCQRVDRVDLAAPGDRLAVDQRTSDQLDFHPVTTSPKLVPTSVNSQPSTPATPISDPIMTPIATPATTPAVTPAATPLTRPITVYQANLACDQLQPQTLALPSGDRLTEIEAAINVILKQWTAGDFPIAGYRVTFADTTAIVDLRAAPDASRPWQALSTCEQFALFRAIRTTLMQHPAWAIEQVRFTSLGTPIEL